MVSHSGACLCGATKVDVEVPESLAKVAKHHRSGGGYTANVIAPKDAVKTSGAYKEYKSTASSGNAVFSGFCGECGSSISHHSVGLGGNVALHIGNLSGFEDSAVVGEIFTKDRLAAFKPIDGAFQKDTA